VVPLQRWPGLLDRLLAALDDPADDHWWQDGEFRAAACLRGKVGDGAEHAAREDQAAVEGLVVAMQEAGML
jgi:hypothetical protein